MQVTITTSPSGRSITVDDKPYTSPQTFSWTPGAKHTIATTSPQLASGTRFLFFKWSDGFPMSHDITVPSTPTTYTAEFTTQYSLTSTSSPAAGGNVSVTPPSTDRFYNSGISVQVMATPASGYSFADWSGDLSGTTNPQSVVMSAPRSVTANFKVTSLVQVTITTNPVGRAFTVDGKPYASSQTFSWTPGDKHTIATTSPQLASGTRYLFFKWSDGFPMSHDITVPSTPTTYIAEFTTQYFLTKTTSPAAGGNVSATPASADGFYDSGASVQLTATPASGYSFANWSGDLSGTTNPQSVVLSAPRSVTANFKVTSLVQVTITTNPVGRDFTVDDKPFTSPQTFSWTPGTSYTIATTSPQVSSGTRFLFFKWSNGQPMSHKITVPSTPTTYIAEFTTQYFLTKTASPAASGNVSATPPSADGFYDSGTEVQVTATVSPGYSFVNWSGDLSGTKNPQSLLMSVPRSVIASFATSGGFTLTDIAPVRGPVIGGTEVVLTGTGFQSGVSVNIGGIAAIVRSVTGTQINATTGGGLSAGTFNVVVTNPGGQSATLFNAFSYTPVVVQLSGLHPSSVLEGNASFSLIVNGSNFTSGSQVRWNGSARVTEFIHNTQLKASISTADILTPGTAQISVITGSDVSANALPFAINTNNAPAELTAVLPNSGSTQGNIKISFIGRNLKPRMVSGNVVRPDEPDAIQTVPESESSHCPLRLGGVCIESLQFVNSTEVTATTPPRNTPGPVEAALARDDGSQSVVPQAFTYKTLQPISPPVVPDGGKPRIRQRIPFVVDTSEFRTNLGVNNLGNSPATVDIFFTNNNGEEITRKTIPVAANGMRQINNVARFLEDASELTGSEGYLILESADSIGAWASQLDNLTDDPSIQQARSETTAATRVLIPSSASINQFLTSLILINNSATAGQVTIRARRSDGTIQAELVNQPIKANGYLHYENFYQRFPLTNVFGPIEIEASGGIKVTAAARIYTREGTSGYFEGVDATKASRTVVLPYSLDTFEFRTNLGITNPGPNLATVIVSLLDKDGLVINSVSTSVPAHGMTQLNQINQTLSYNGEAYLRLNSDQPIFGWSSQIDKLTEDVSLVVGKVQSNPTSLLIPSTTNTGGFRSTLVVVNLASTPTTVELTSRDNDGNLRTTQTRTLPGNGFTSFADILNTLNLADSYGPLEIRSTDGRPIQAVSRVYSTQRTGGYFEGVPIVP